MMIRIKDLRLGKSMNQTQIAELLNTTQKVYSRYETGERTLPLKHLITLAKFYNVSLDYLCGITEIRNEFPRI